MAKPKTEQKSNGQVPIEAIPHLWNAQMLKWQRTHYEALAAIHKELVAVRELLEKEK